MGNVDTSKLLHTLPAPTRVHCEDFHAQRMSPPDGAYAWREPAPPSASKGELKTAQSHYACGYCGSMHPTDLAGAILSGATASWADGKYGWPHKLYVENIPNRYAGEMEIRSTTYRGGEHTVGPQTPAGDTTLGKFYTVHLQDATPEERQTIERVMGMSFEFENGSVRWRPFIEAH